MAETTGQLKDEIALTRTELSSTIGEIGSRLEATRRRIPFYGPAARQQLLMLAGALVLSSAVVFLAFYTARRL